MKTPLSTSPSVGSRVPRDRRAAPLAAALLLLSLPALAAVPHRWTVEASRVAVEQIEAFRGEGIDLEASLNAYGKPLELPSSADYFLYWQTNGMGTAYWVTNAALSASNVLSAAFRPEFAPAAGSVRGFVGSPDSSYRAAFTIRFRDAPGATPNELPVPTAAIDFSKVTVYHPPYYTKAETDAKIAAATPADYANVANLASNAAPKSALGDYALKSSLSSLAPLSSLTSHTADTNNPHKVTATQVGAVPTTRKVNSKALSADITLGAADVGAYSSGDGTALAKRVTQTEADVGVLTAYVSGTDAALTVTNYLSSTQMPAAELAVKIEDEATGSNVLTTVWREMTRWDAHNAAVDSYTNAVNAALAEKADRAWGLYDSETGNAAPDGFTSISSERIRLGGGSSYMEVATTGGSIWVLTSNVEYEPTGIVSNGAFQVRDSDGNALIEIVKGDKAVVAANPSSVTVTNETTLVAGYAIISDAHPTGEVCLDLKEGVWKSETADDCPATVTWGGTSGDYVVSVTPNTATATCFFRATYETGGDTYVKHNAAIGMSEIVLNGKTYTLGTATIDGHTVLTLTAK